MNRWPGPRLSAQVRQRHLMPEMEPRFFLPPPLYGVGIGPEATGNLRPRRPDSSLKRFSRCGKSRGRRAAFSCTVCAVVASGRSFRRTAAISLQLRCPGRPESPGRTVCGAQAPAASPTRSPGGGRRSACPKAPAASPASHMRAGFFCCPPLARTADGRHQLVGQHPAVSGADGSVVATVLGGGVAGGVELHRHPAPIS